MNNTNSPSPLIVDLLLAEYPHKRCALDYNSPFELLVASRLSAQCTDARVNIVSAILFKRYKTIEDYATADIIEMEKLVYSCGFYHIKARDIIEAAQMVKEKGFPKTMDEMLLIPGIGRKIANLLMGEIYEKNDVIIADTHCIRLSNRLGYCKTKDAGKVEIELKNQILPENQFEFSHALVTHGRAICKAANPSCSQCIVEKYCIKAEVK